MGKFSKFDFFIKQFKSMIDAQPELKKEAQKWTSQQILTAIGAIESHPEGLLTATKSSLANTISGKPWLTLSVF